MSKFLQLFLLSTTIQFHPSSSSFINFTPFSFPHGNSSGDDVHQTSTTLSILRALIGGHSPPLVNISLATGPNSAIGINAIVCDAKNGNWSGAADPRAAPILFASSMAYKSALVHLDELPKGVDRECQEEVEEGHGLLQLAITSLVPGSEGSVAIRQMPMTNEEEEEDGGKEEEEEGRIVEREERELELPAGGLPLLVPLNGPIGTADLGGAEMEAFRLDLAVRRASVQLSVVQQCAAAPPLNASSSPPIVATTRNRTIPLGIFPMGQFPRLLVGHASGPLEAEGDASFNISTSIGGGNGTAIDGAESQRIIIDMLNCDQSASGNASDNNSAKFSFRRHSAASAPPRLLLAISAFNGSSPIVAFSLSRTFRPILVAQNAAAQGHSDGAGGWGWGTIVALGLLLPLLLLAAIVGGATFANHFLVQRKRMDYECQRKEALELQMGFFEVNLHRRQQGGGGTGANPPLSTNNRPSPGGQKRRVAPGGTRVDLAALSAKALGGTGPGWI